MKYIAGILSFLLICVTISSSATLSSEDNHKIDSGQAEGLGRSITSGNLTIARIADEGIQSAISSSNFSLHAGRLVVETDRSDLSTGSIRPLVESDNQEYFHAEVTGLENRAHYRLSVWPYTGDVSFEARDHSCSSTIPSAQEKINQMPMVDSAGRENNETQMDETLRWQNCSDSASITIAGDFLVRLWEWDAELTAHGERETLRSGQQNHESLPDEIPDLSLVAGEAQEQYLFATNATLTIPRLDGYHEIYLNQASLNATNGYRLSQTHGNLLGIPLQGEEVIVDGDGLILHATGTGLDEPLSASLDGPIDRLKINGESVATTPRTHDDSKGFPFPVILALIAIGLLIIMGTATTVWKTNPRLHDRIAKDWSIRRNRRFNQALEEVHEYSAHQPKKVRKWARIAFRLQPSHPEAMAALGEAYFHHRKYRKALKNYQNAIEAIDGHYVDPQVSKDTAAFWAVDAARCLGRMRVRVTDIQKREQLAEHALLYTHIACKVDPEIAQVLLKEVSLQDLERQIQGILEGHEYSLP